MQTPTLIERNLALESLMDKYGKIKNGDCFTLQHYENEKLNKYKNIIFKYMDNEIFGNDGMVYTNLLGYVLFAGYYIINKINDSKNWILYPATTIE